MEQSLKVIAKIYTAHKEKFGIPRQSGMVELPAEIVFEPQYRDPNAVRGLDGFSHIWVLWQFSEAKCDGWQPTVRPPRLGGNKRMGVFATRSPFRPNSIGLSSLKLEKVELTADKGPVLHVSGADILDGTPIFDIKPYIAFTDSHPDAICGFSEGYKEYKLKVEFSNGEIEKIDPELRDAVTELLSCDPRPSYQTDTTRVYGLDVSGYSVKFTVDGEVLTVV
ncbi:MAG: tRNA (N6-threonylcarbamoyladenosine(37)-N6)-methyltransferase TrmO, partial [Clostridia bacterium]|nr:tRNA (N6-threonylcarbamoyladenosine(37)-N6)-methyltransferase TrmO [Clostridia bacterium]